MDFDTFISNPLFAPHPHPFPNILTLFFLFAFSNIEFLVLSNFFLLFLKKMLFSCSGLYQFGNERRCDDTGKSKCHTTLQGTRTSRAKVSSFFAFFQPFISLCPGKKTLGHTHTKTINSIFLKAKFILFMNVVYE